MISGGIVDFVISVAGVVHNHDGREIQRNSQIGSKWTCETVPRGIRKAGASRQVQPDDLQAGGDVIGLHGVSEDKHPAARTARICRHLMVIELQRRVADHGYRYICRHCNRNEPTGTRICDAGIGYS